VVVVAVSYAIARPTIVTTNAIDGDSAYNNDMHNTNEMNARVHVPAAIVTATINIAALTVIALRFSRTVDGANFKYGV
jgi:hypothetical protein